MSHFCRITGRTRGVPPRSHYVPLLPPISKADARKLATCHVTRGAQAMPYPHHFIPVLLVQRKRKATLVHGGMGRGPLFTRPEPGKSSLQTIEQAPAEVWPPPDFEKRRREREAALQKIEEARGGRPIVPPTRERRTYEEERSTWDEDEMLGRKMQEESSRDQPTKAISPEAQERMKAGGVPSEEVTVPQPATAEEMGEAAPPDEPMNLPHKVLSEYRYVIPVLEGEPAKPLQSIIAAEEKKAKIMEAEEGGPNSRYVYIVDQYQCGIVVTSQIESAIRGGAVEEVMVSPNLEKVALRLKRPGIKPGTKLTGENVVTVEAKLLMSEELEKMTLLEGAGPDDIKWTGLEEELAMTESGIVMQETVIGGGTKEDERVALVPGQVVETSAGPRFVPGQIVVQEGSKSEEGKEADKIQFVPGEVVETSEGPRFVAPDLTETADGKMEFSVQGFAVEDVGLEKTAQEGAAARPELKRRLSLKLEGMVEEIVTSGEGKADLPQASKVTAIVSEKDMKSQETGPEPMQVEESQEASKKRRSEEEGDGQAMLRHLSKKLQTKDVRDAGDASAPSESPQVVESEFLSKEELELRVEEMRRLAAEAASLGASLGLPSADAATLLQALSDPETAKTLASDPVSVRLLRGGVKALRKQRRRELRRASRTNSGLLSLTEVAGEEDDDDDDMDEDWEGDIPEVIRSSRDIPSVLFKKLQDPSLAANDQEELANKILAGLKSSSDDPIPRPGSPESVALVILKDNLQAVFPREASRSLLTGNAPFTIIDENGIRRFKPAPLGAPSKAPLKPVSPQVAAKTQVADTPKVDKSSTEGTQPADSAKITDVQAADRSQVAPSQAAEPKIGGTQTLDKTQAPVTTEKTAPSTGEKPALSSPQQEDKSKAGIVQAEDAKQVKSSEAVGKKETEISGSVKDVEMKAVPESTKTAGESIKEQGKDQPMIDTSVKSLKRKEGGKTEDHSSTTGFSITSLESQMEAAALQARWVARVAYTPGADDPEGLALAEGDTVELVPEEEGESSAKRARMQTTEVTQSFFSSTTVEGSSAVTSTTASSTTSLLDNSAAKHKISIRPKRKHADPRQRGTGVVTSTSASTADETDDRVLVRKVEEPNKQGWVPASVLSVKEGTGLESGLSLSVVVAASQQEEFMDIDQEENETPEEIAFKRDAVIRELVETEEEFGKDLKFVVEKYLKPLEDHLRGAHITPSSSSASVGTSPSGASTIPRLVRDHKDVIFGNFMQISEFHNGVLIEGFKYYANEPKMLGRTFLRLERDFDKHVAYCRDEPKAQEFIDEHEEVKEYFDEYSQQIGDDKSLSEHLKLPIQRINDYQLLLKELVKYCVRLGEDATDLQRALELMLGVPHRSGDLKFISSIEGYRGNIHKLGRLLRHDWFSIEEGEGGGKTKERYLFLFKGKILVCKVKRIQDDRSVFVLKEILKLPELEWKDIPEDTKAFHLRRNPKVEATKGEFEANFPLIIKAHADDVKAEWLAEIRQHAVEFQDKPVIAEVTPKPEPSTKEEKAPVPEQRKEESKSISQPTSVAEKTPPQAESKPTPPATVKEDTTDSTKVSKKTEEVPPVQQTKAPEETKVAEVTPPPKKTEVTPEASPVLKQPESPQPPPKPSESTSAPSPDTKKTEATPSESKPEEPKKAEVPPPPKPEEVPSAPKPIQADSPPEPSKEADITSVGTKRKESEVDEKESQVKTEDNPPKKLAKEDTSETTDGQKEQAEMSSFSVTRKSSQSTTRIEEYQSVSASYAASSQEEVYMETSSSSSSRMASGLRTSSVKFESDGMVSENGALAIESIPSTPTIEKGRTGSDKRPVFIRRIEGYTCEPGETASFECEIRSDSITSLTWLKDNRPLDDKLADRISTKKTDDRHQLQILNCRETDTGLYTALASNESGKDSCTAQLTVEELSPDERRRRAEDKAPIFLVQLKDTELIENTYLRFLVKVKGNPNPIVRFYKDGKEICSEKTEDHVHVSREQGQKKGYYELVIIDVQHSDAGKYSCLAVNEYGEASCEGYLTVTDHSSIFASLGDDTDFTSDKPTFTWFKDGHPFDPEERFKVLFKDDEDSLALVFQHVKPEDAGLYTCVAQTTTGKISCSAELTVKGTVREPEKPKLTTENKTTEVNFGGSAMLEVKTTGYPKPDIKWFRESGEEITAGGRYRFLYEDEESISLVVKGTTSEDSGKYKITAKNDFGEDTAEIELIVKSPPKIITKTTDMVCKVQETFEMTIEVEGTPSPDVKWYKDGQEVSASATVKIGSKKGSTSSSMSHSLTLTQTKLEDAGSYSLVATNDLSQSSCFWKLTVTSPPRFVRNPPTELIIGEGEAVTIEARVEGFPAPNVKWLKDDKEIQGDGKKIKITSEGISHSISITGSGRGEAGVYTCVATNEHGSAQASSTLHVKCPPQFRQGLPKEAQANEGDVNVEFVVNVEAYPKPNIKWYLDEVEITEKKTEYTRIEEGDNYKLVIREVTTETSGKYSCKVFNDFGSTESSCSFTVHCKPRFPKGLSDKAADEGDSLTLTIECYANPEPEVKWYKNGEEIKVDARISIKRQGSESYSLSFDVVKKEDTGEYEVRAKNNMGEASTSSKLHVHSSTQTDVIEDEEKKDEDEKIRIKRFIEEEEIEIEEEENLIRTKKMPEDDEGKLEKSRAEEVKLNAQKVEESEVPSSKGSANLLTPHTIEKETFDSSGNKIEEDINKSQKGQMNPETIEEGVLIEEPPSPVCVSNLQPEMNKPATSMSGVSIVSLSESEDDAQQTPNAAKEEKISFDEFDGSKALQGKQLNIESAMEEEQKIKASAVEEQAVKQPEKAGLLEKNDAIEMPSKASNLEEKDITPSSEKGLMKSIVSEEMAAEASTALTADVAQSKQALIKEKGETKEVDSSSVTAGVGTSESVPQKGIQLEKGVAQEVAGENEEEDEAVEELLKRVKKQRSVLEEILDKENGRKQEVAPEILSSNMTDGSLYESLSKVYEVKATGSPRPEAKWQKDGQVLKASDRIIISDSGEDYKLEIKDSLMSDEGVYKCTVSNRMGEKSVECKLKLTSVNEFRKPKMSCELKDVKVKKGEDAVLRATIISDPVPDITWYHGDKALGGEGDKVVAEMEEGPKEVGDGLKECTFTLLVPAGQHFDSGVYRIHAKNKFGEGESSARLDILLKPEISGMKDVTTIPHETIIFKVVIYANPLAKVTWTRGEEKLSTTEKVKILEDLKTEEYQIQLFDVGLAEDGVYTVTAVNDQGETTSTATLKVHTEPPSFVKNLDDITVKAYHDADFRVRVNGIPKPQIKWYKDGEELKTGGRIIIETDEEHQTSSLTIQHMEEEDEGKYKVRASNIVGEAETVSKLSMAQIPPSFTRPLDRSLEIDEGDHLELKVKVDGSPIPTVKWYKDGEEIPPGGHIEMVALPDGNIKLSIESMKPTDCGAYKLVVANKNGEKAAICAVAVKPTPRRPSFVKGLEGAKLIVGEPLKLEVQVMAFPAPEIKWFKDGHPVRPSLAVNFVNQPGGIIGLHIDHARPEDAGHYTVTVANRLGEISGEADVEIEEQEKKPSFQAILQPVSVVEGYPAKMEIKVSGHPKPTLKWTHNGKEIVPDGQKFSVNELPDGTVCLLIDKATPADAGEYAVTASNGKGDVTSKAKLDVAGKTRDAPEEPPTFVHQLRDVSADEGSSLVLEAPFLGNPIPEVKWTKDGLPLSAGERNMMTCDGKRVGLEVKPANLNDAGQYECTLTNPLGSATSSAKAMIRKIYQAPSFVQTFGNLQQVPGFDAKFPVKVTGFPAPELTWYKNGERINAAKHPEKYRIRKDGDTCCLFVRDCAPTDAGCYSCKAVNLDGEASCEATLKVVDKIDKDQKGEAPSFLKRIGDCEVCQGMTAKFTACAMGYPEPEFEWRRNGERLFPSDRIKSEKEGSGLLRLSIFNVCPADVGQYALRIFNPHGEDICEAQLTYDSLESKPKRPIGDQYVDYDKFRRTGLPLPLADRPIISRMTDRRLTLSWKPYIPIGSADYRGPPVTYRLEMCEMPDGDWFTVRSGIRSCACDVSNLEPYRDYKFRVRVENKYGISDPSPFAVTYREKLEPEPPKFFPYLEPGIDFRPETSPYFPKDFDIEKPPHDGYSQAPRFLRPEHDTQYGVKGHNCNLFWFVYGYPKPKMTYYFNDEVIEMGGRYNASYTRNGQATLFINKMLDRDVGWYEAVARNEHGEARQRVRLEIAEFPKFISRPEEIVIMLRRSGRLEARVTGVPYPEIKWYKDWQPLAPSSRIKMMFHPPDTCILSINDVINRDEGLYSIGAANVAGSVSASAMIHVEEDERQYALRTYGRYGVGRPEIKPRPSDGPKGFNELYDIGDELGRGTQGITYHAVERLSGRNYAAKIMHAKGLLRPFMYNELEILNMLNHRKILRLHEAFESDRSLTLILELAAGGEFFDVLSRQTYYTESEIAGYVRQVLWGLEHMHEHSIAHLGLTPGDILFSHPGGDEVKICDFGLARRISFGKLASLNYGVPEFVSPEVVRGDGVGLAADMWSLGIIVHLLLSGGMSLFHGQNDKETLERIKSVSEDYSSSFLSGLPDYLSPEARDFIIKLLRVDSETRIDVSTALKHPWLVRADRMVQDEYQIRTSGLKTYLSGLRDWYSNASCRKWFRRRPLEGAYTDPSRMVYPPGMSETPPDTPRISVDRNLKETTTWESKLPPRAPLDFETGTPKSESHYQYGPDTYLLQLRDVSFPVRLREYMKVAAHRSPGYSRTIADSNYDWRTPIIRERRRFTDIMDEEIDDERKTRIDCYGSRDSLDGIDGLPSVTLSNTITPRRLRHELGTRLDAHAEAEAYMESKRDGQIPFFREKPQIMPIRVEEPAELVCLAVGDPKPIVQWFKNDLVITESNRIKIIEDDDGRSILRLNPAVAYDVGIYKVVARNKIGQTVARTRMILATTPAAPDSPEAADISDSEILLKWKQPHDDGNSPILCYSLQYKESDQVDWIDIGNNIDHEFYLLGGLKPSTSYHFRLASRNRIGWSTQGIVTELVKTKEEGSPKVQISRAMRHLQQITESGAQVIVDDTKHHIDYSNEKNPPQWNDGCPSDKFQFISEINRGRFSSVVKALEKSSDRVVAAKVFEWRQAPTAASADGVVANGVPKGGSQLSESGEAAVQREFEMLRSLRHERVAFLESAWHGGGIAAFIMEKLQGADVLTFLSSRHEYSEQIVATIITQVLDGLQYLHWRGYCHLDIQPDNIVMASVRSVHVKLVDFGSAQRVTRLGTPVSQVGHPEYAAPEIQSEDPVAYPQSDIWSVGVIAYVLLSGESPFRGATTEETHQNVNFVRFRFEYLYKELTQEATRFIMLIFKKAPSKRPLAEECHEHRWLLPSEYMIKKRDRAIFLGNRLKEFSERYHSERASQASKASESLSNALGGGRGALLRSTSIQEELIATT